MSILVLSSNDTQFKGIIDELSQLTIYTIGRKATNTIVVANGKISGQHARLIQCTPTSFVLEDLESKNGTFVNGARITRKIVDKRDTIQLADSSFIIDQLLQLIPDQPETPATSLPQPEPIQVDPKAKSDKAALDFIEPFSALQQVFEQYPQLRRDCRNREKMIRTGSVILSSIVGVSAVLTTGGTVLPLLHIMSSAGLSMLVPTLCSTLLSTDEKLEVIDKEYRERYRCPNPACRDPFGAREWDLLAQQKTCRRCQAIWMN